MQAQRSGSTATVTTFQQQSTPAPVVATAEEVELATKLGTTANKLKNMAATIAASDPKTIKQMAQLEKILETHYADQIKKQKSADADTKSKKKVDKDAAHAKEISDAASKAVTQALAEKGTFDSEWDQMMRNATDTWIAQVQASAQSTLGSVQIHLDNIEDPVQLENAVNAFRKLAADAAVAGLGALQYEILLTVSAETIWQQCKKQKVPLDRFKKEIYPHITDHYCSYEEHRKRACALKVLADYPRLKMCQKPMWWWAKHYNQVKERVERSDSEKDFWRFPPKTSFKFSIASNVIELRAPEPADALRDLSLDEDQEVDIENMDQSH